MNLSYEPLAQIDISDPFFDSLKGDYGGFEQWYRRKSAEFAYVSRNAQRQIDGFLYLKLEDGPVEDVAPPMGATRRMKVGTFKITPRGTRMGERFVKKIFDHALASFVDELYVTVFSKHDALIGLLSRYGFAQKGVKVTTDGEEIVLVRQLGRTTGNIAADYPFFSTANAQCALLAIYPQWHTRLFPDSRLKNEAVNIVRDVSHTNSIHKVYLCGMDGVLDLKAGDILLIYRTKEQSSAAPAHYTSVVTSVCVVEETRHIGSFNDLDSFLAYTRPYSVFTDEELKGLWQRRR